MKRRNSLTQKRILAVLLRMEQANIAMPVKATQVQALINRIRTIEMQPHAFRGAVHKLKERQLLIVSLNESAKLEISLTPQGREMAKPILETML